VLNNLSVLFRTTGRVAQARALLEQAIADLERRVPANDLRLAAVYQNLASALSQIAQFDEAERLLRRALEIRESLLPAGHREIGITMSNLGVRLMNAGKLNEAEPLLRRALAMLRQAQPAKHGQTASAMSNLAVLLEKAGRPTEAESLFLNAYRVLLDAGMPREAATIQGNLMRFYAPTDRRALPKQLLALSIFYGKQSVNAIQALRAALRGSTAAIQRTFVGPWRNTYTGLADRLIEAGRIPEAQQVLSMLKEQEFSEFIRGAETDSGATNFRIMPMTSTEAHASQLLQDAKTLANAETAFAAAVDRVKQSFVALAGPALSESASIDPAHDPIDQVLARSGASESVLMLQTLTLKRHLRLIVSGASGRKAYTVAIARETLRRRVNALAEALRSPRLDPRPAARELYEILIRPLEAEIATRPEAKVILLSTDGELRQLPFAALHDGTRYLGQRVATVLDVVGSGRQAETASRRPWIAAMGVSRAHPGFRSLPAVALELRAIVRDESNPSGALPGRYALDESFTAEHLKLSLSEGRASIIHLATHYRFSPLGEHESFLLTGDGERLSLAQFRKGGFDFTGVDLLAISACETARARRSSGIEVEALAVVARKLGARSVMATLWSVADESTAHFMQRFYKARHSGGLSKAQALRQAQIDMIEGRKNAAAAGPRWEPRGASAANALPRADVSGAPHARYSHPFYWAPFIMMGAWH
ncbi:MAG: CHAT domain-containing protein, partial [Burkholderiaceae bacterium]|nr:CHAT domain-containing protein [Burkholderiaceae bacterium]